MSLFPGSFSYEKYFSGKYIGDLARLVVQDLQKKGLLDLPGTQEWLSNKGSFTAEDLSNCVLDLNQGGAQRTQAILERVGGCGEETATIRTKDAKIIQGVCQVKRTLDVFFFWGGV